MTLQPTDNSSDSGEHAIDCRDLHYAFVEGAESALTGATLQLPKGARCLLVGANGGEHMDS